VKNTDLFPKSFHIWHESRTWSGLQQITSE